MMVRWELNRLSSCVASTALVSRRLCVKRKYGSMNEPDVKRLRELEKENVRLKRLLAERESAIDVMKEF